MKKCLSENVDSLEYNFREKCDELKMEIDFNEIW